jgi:hypothetical protein
MSATSTSSKGQARKAAAKITAAIRKGWRPGAGPICSYGSRRARRQEGVASL